MKAIAGALVILAGSIVFAAGAVAESVQMTVDKTFNFHPSVVEAAAPVGGLLFLIGLAVLVTGYLEGRRPKEPPS